MPLFFKSNMVTGFEILLRYDVIEHKRLLKLRIEKFALFCTFSNKKSSFCQQYPSAMFNSVL